jgi:hypothetical protein
VTRAAAREAVNIVEGDTLNFAALYHLPQLGQFLALMQRFPRVALNKNVVNDVSVCLN